MMRLSEVHVLGRRESPGSLIVGSTIRCLFLTADVMTILQERVVTEENLVLEWLAGRFASL